MQADKNVLVAVDDLICNDHLDVGLRAHAQVHEVGVALVQLFQRLLRLHNEVGDQGRVLHAIDVLGEGTHWDACERESVARHGVEAYHHG